MSANVIDVSDPADPRLDDFRDLNSVDRRPDLPTGKGLVIAEGVLVVPGSSFNVAYRNHFRVTLLPQPAEIREVFARIERALARQLEAPARQAAIA